jgi:hypothetical protein
MQEPSGRTREIFVYTCCLAICILFLLFIFFFVSYRCGQMLLEDGGAAGCTTGTGWSGLAGGFLVIALFSLYRVNKLMQGKS